MGWVCTELCRQTPDLRKKVGTCKNSLCRAENKGLKAEPRWVTISFLCPEGLGAHESDANILQGGSCFEFLPDVN